AAGSAQKTEQPEFPAAIDHKGEKRARDAHDGNKYRDRLKRVRNRKSAVKNTDRLSANFAIGRNKYMVIGCGFKNFAPDGLGSNTRRDIDREIRRRWIGQVP